MYLASCRYTIGPQEVPGSLFQRVNHPHFLGGQNQQDLYSPTGPIPVFTSVPCRDGDVLLGTSVEERE